jgi:ankyrin repeat protein
MSIIRESEATAKLLVDVYQANVNIVDNEGAPLLHYACQTGNETIIRALFKTTHNLEVEVKDSDGRTALMRTIRSGALPIADLLISFGADLWTQDFTQYTTLHGAVHNGWEGMVKTLLDAGLSPEARSVDGWTPLHEVSRSKSLSILKMLLEKGGDIHSENIDGLQVFHEAVRAESREGTDQLLLCEELIRLGCSLEKKARCGWTPLHLASLAGSTAVVELLLDHKVDIDVRIDLGETSLYLAAFEGHHQVLELLVRREANSLLVDRDGKTPLQTAATYGKFECVRILVETRPNDINMKNKKGITALAYAASNDHLEIVRVLLEKGADPDIACPFGQTPLLRASYFGHLRIVEALLSATRLPNAKTKAGWTAVYTALQQKNPEVAEYLVRKGVDCESKSDFGIAPIHLAAENGQVGIMSTLLSVGADANMRTERFKHTPLLIGAQNGHESVVDLLLKSDADPTIRTTTGWSSLHAAATSGNVQIFRKLQQYFELLNPVNDQLYTPIHEAAAKGNIEIVKLLLDNDVRVDVQDSARWQPLHCAADANQMEVFCLLLERGADVDERDGGGHTAAHLAAGKGYVQILQKLQERHADLNARTWDGYLPLHLAARCGSVQSLEFLMTFTTGVPNVTTCEGATPLHYAARNGHFDAVKFLLQMSASPAAFAIIGGTPSTLASRFRQRDVVCLLDQQSPQDMMEDEFGLTSLDYASKRVLSGSKPNLQRSSRLIISLLYRINVIQDSIIAHKTSREKFQDLGRFLMILDEDLEDAQIAFEMEMNVEEGGFPEFHYIQCNLCAADTYIHEKRYICLSCPEVDFCKAHYDFYKSFRVCRDHEFLETSQTEGEIQKSDFQCAVPSDEHATQGKWYKCVSCSNVGLCENHYESYRTLSTCTKHEFSEVVLSEQPTKDGQESLKPRCKRAMDDHDIRGKQYTCKTCSNVSLCATHFDSYDIFDVCTEHQFIEVPRPSWKPGKVPLGAVNEDGLLLGDWLEALRAKWYEILRRISPKTLGFFEHMHPQYLANPERYLERIEHLQSEVYNDCLLTQLFEVGTASKQLTHNSPILEQDQEGMRVSELDNLGLRGQLVSSYLPLAKMPSADSSELEQITTHLKRNYTMCSQAMIAIERLQDAGHCSSYFSIFVIDCSRSDVASLKRVTKHMVENFQQLLGIVTHVFETKTLQTVDPASEKEPPKLSNILEELDDEAYDFLRSLGIAQDSRAQGQTLLSLMSSCTILSHVLLLGISAYAGSHSSLFAEELFGLSLTDFRLSRPSGDIFFSLMDLVCMHDFIGGPIWVFTEESRLIRTEKLCVSMYATDLDDLWGPAYFRSKNGSDQVELIEIERGAIVKIRDSSQHDEVVCHYVAWDAVEAQGLELPPELSPFSRESKLLIGAPSGYESTDASPQCRFDVNPDCNYVADMLQSSPSWTPEGFKVVHLGVTEARWTLDSIVVSGHAGKVVGFGGSLDYKRTPKQNHRARIAMCFTNEGVDVRLLNYRFGLEVSACTQNARRTTLWDCIKSPRVREKVENSCEGIEPRHLEALNSEKNFRALWKFGRWTKENSKPLTDILKVIFIFLSYTGTDSRGHLRAWWDLDNLIELPHSRNSWIDMISHTENGVFAYVSESCLQCHCAGSHGTEGIRCRRRTDKSGKGRTAYFTALSYEEQRDELQTQPPAPEAPSTGTATDKTAKIPESTSKQAQPPTRYTVPMLDTEWLKLNCKPMKEALNPPLQRYGGIQAAREEIPNHNDFSRPFDPQVREENRRQRSQRERLERVRALTRDALSDSVPASSTLLFDSPSVRAARSDRRRMRSRFLHDEFLDPRNQDFLGSDYQIGSSGRFPQRTLDNQFHRTARESNGEDYASVDSRVDYSFGHSSATRMEQQPATQPSKMKIPIQTQQIRGSRLPMDASRGFPSQCSANEALPESSDDQARHLQSEKPLVPGNLRLFTHNKPLRLSPLAVLHPVRDQHIPVFKGLHIPLFKSIPVPAHPERWNDAESSQRPLLVQFDFNMSPSMFFENATVSVVEKGLETASKIPGTYRPTQRAARRFSDRIEDSGKRVVLTEVIDDLSAKGMVVPVCVISV